MKKKMSLMLAVILILQIMLPMLTVIWENALTLNSIAKEDLVTIQFKDVNMYNKIVEELTETGWYNSLSNNDINLTISMTQSDIDKVKYLELNNYCNFEGGNLTDTPITDISGIENFRNLEQLEIINNSREKEGLTNINNLQYLTKLQKLNLYGNCISDISALKGLTDLKCLLLNNNEITNIDALSSIINLEELTLNDNNISDITSIQSLTSLYRLELNDNNITNIEAIKDLTGLYMLDLRSNDITDISSLSNLTNLGLKFFGSLDLSYNNISDISPIENLVNLETLSLAGNKIKDIRVLSNLVNLKYLDLNGNQIDDISTLFKLDNLKYPNEVVGSQKITLSTNRNEGIVLPIIFLQLRGKINPKYCIYEDNFKLDNCILNEDKTKVNIIDDTKDASVSLTNGRFTCELIVKKQKPIQEPKTEFVIGRDNNSFTHTSSSNFNSAGFIGVTNYQIPQKYFDAITKNSTDGQKDAVIAREHEGWNGSCYGIAAMMGLAYYNRIDLEDIQPGVTDFFELDYPYKQEKLLNLIQSYYLMQVSGEKVDYQYMKPFLFGLIKDSDNDYDNLNSFLEDLVSTTKQEIVQLGYGNSKGGHEILACGSEQLEDGTYRIKLYDMNSVRDDNSGQFKYMTINSDFSEFTIENALEGKPMNNKNYRYIRFRRFSDYKIITEDNNELIMKSSAEQKENELVLLFNAASNFTIKNSENETLTYNGENLSGNMEVRDVNFVANGEDNQEIILKVPYSEELIYEEEGEQTNISIYDNDNYMSVEGSNINNAVIDLDEDIKVKGEECKAKVQIDNKNGGLYEINAEVQNEVEVRRQSDNIKVSSDEKIENVTVNELTVEEENELVNSIEAKNVNIDENGNVTSYDEVLKGDTNGDGKVDFKDILAINKHRLNKAKLTGIYLEAGDVNGDGKVDFKDILQINKYRLGKISKL